MKRKRKTSSLKALKAKAWKLMSEYSRRKEADGNGMVKCVCCGVLYHWTEGHAGHYIHAGSRGKDGNAVSYDHRGINFQCAGCNTFGRDDAPHKYSLYMRKKYGEGIDEELRAIKCQSDLKREDFEDRIIPELEKKLEELNEPATD